MEKRVRSEDLPVQWNMITKHLENEEVILITDASDQPLYTLKKCGRRSFQEAFYDLNGRLEGRLKASDITSDQWSHL